MTTTTHNTLERQRSFVHTVMSALSDTVFGDSDVSALEWMLDAIRDAGAFVENTTSQSAFSFLLLHMPGALLLPRDTTHAAAALHALWCPILSLTADVAVGALLASSLLRVVCYRWKSDDGELESAWRCLVERLDTRAPRTSETTPPSLPVRPLQLAWHDNEQALRKLFVARCPAVVELMDHALQLQLSSAPLPGAELLSPRHNRQELPRLKRSPRRRPPISSGRNGEQADDGEEHDEIMLLL